MENENKRAFGAQPSPHDQRTIVHAVTAVAPLVTGGIIYTPEDHLNQWYVGICTAIAVVQNRRKLKAREYSWDFQYLLQKKYYDQGWYEGSSIFSSLKIARAYGFLPAELWTHTTIEDLKLPYAEYIEKLKAIPDSEIERLIGLCVDKIPGYAAVDVNDPQALAKAINDSEVGILCRYEVGAEWYAPSDPLKPPVQRIGAHAIGMTYFNYVVNVDQKLANTWGGWNGDGNANVDWNTYKPSEAWVILKETPIILHPTLRKGSKGDAVKLLQTELNKVMNAGLLVDGDFGPKTLEAVKKFQAKYRLSTDGVVGAKTWQALDMIEIITKVCDEKGVEPLLGISVATCESGLNPKATLYNPPSKSMDRGLFQWNNKYHPHITDPIAFDPVQATRLFCDAVKQGKLHAYWSASQPCWIKKITPELIAKYKLN